MDWQGKPLYPRADFLSSSRKRLAPQLLFKGGILKIWEKKQAVVLDRAFFDTLPALPTVDPADADLAWFVYRLDLEPATNEYRLVLDETVYTSFTPTLQTVTTAVPGPVDVFVEKLQAKLDQQLHGAVPDAPSLIDIIQNEN